ncbi:phosphomethylpyrimidine synthase ThiC [Frigoriglobus tundricola]|uniref:Phosphomethylpyrimidine synthase ThiC n=1 Tax=Frigoriglobus tundricola TaxID=2774151 RepID=A0A6M5YQI3_9BACT|nr:phosphomethylpyrimidine synthase ThiC [Frigoriglobus tundricola]QJW95626.1 Phosphomethylpyrimidine synthase ThiC [Frigoriglobus tundricola]
MIARLKTRQGIVEAGPGCPTRVMALIGMNSDVERESQVTKIHHLTALPQHPDVIADLSQLRTGNELLWPRVIRDTPCVAATLPIYSVRTTHGRVDATELLDRAVEQIEGGVGLITIHPTPCLNLHTLSLSRTIPCTSRGGNIVATDLASRGWRGENIYMRILRDLLPVAKRYRSVISIGASYRSGTIFDSFDQVQQTEIRMQIDLARLIVSEGVDVIIESPGHARPADIRRVAIPLRTSGFPIMPLGPIPTEASVGQDHISAAIGATLLGLEGCAHILAAVTREEHTGGIPTLTSTLEAVAAAQVAARIIDLDRNGDDSLDREIALRRSADRTCVLGQEEAGCSRCGSTCPLQHYPRRSGPDSLALPLVQDQ